MTKSNNSSEKLDRKMIERNRRIHMKGLCLKLTSLIPSHHFKPSKELLSQQDHFDQAATYIKNLREKVDELKRKKELLQVGSSDNNINNGTISGNVELRLPVFEFRDLGSTLEVVMISGLHKNFMLHKVVNVLHEEGADVVNAHFASVGGRVFHTIHAQVRVCRVGVDTSRVCQRLQELMH